MAVDRPVALGFCVLLGCTTAAPETEESRVLSEEALDEGPEVAPTPDVVHRDDLGIPRVSPVETAPDRTSPFRPLDDPKGGTSLTRTAYVYETPQARTAAPRLEIVPLGQDFLVRFANDRPRAVWLVLETPDDRGDSALYVDLVATDSRGEASSIRFESLGCVGVPPPPLRVPPGATLNLGYARVFAAHAPAHDSWLRIIVSDEWMVQVPGTRAKIHARWRGHDVREQPSDYLPSIRRKDPAARLSDIFVLGEDDVSNTVEIVAEPEAGVVHPREPTAERLPMPDELRETARELGLE